MPEHKATAAGRRIALIAHDNKKQDMLEWAEYNLALLAGHELSATATTGRLLHSGNQLSSRQLPQGSREQYQQPFPLPENPLQNRLLA